MASDLLYEALKPFVGAGWLNQQASGLNDFGWRNYVAIAGNRASFDPSESLQLMRTWNTTYGLGLSDAEIATGIKKFGDWHVQRFGGGLAADSSIPAVAAQSLAEAITAKGGNGYGSTFWQDVAKPGGVLEMGNAAAIQKGKDALAAIQTDWDNNIAVHGSGITDGVSRSYGGDSFGDFLIAAAPLVIAGVAGASALGWGGLAGAAGEAAAAGALSESAALAAADAAAGLIPANTGGMFVGTEGLLGGTGNAIADSALNGAVRSGITSAVTGRDPVQGALSGAAGGLLGTAGLGQQVASGVGATGDAGAAITSGVNAAASTAASTAIAGGSFSDILENSLTSGITQGAGSYVSNVLDSGSTAIDRGVGGAVTGGLNAAITGGDVGAGLLTSGLSGAAGGAATDAGYGPEVAGVVQNVTGGLLNSALQEETAIQVPAPTTTTPAPSGGLSFSDIVPQFKDVTRSTEWGDRLFSAGRI